MKRFWMFSLVFAVGLCFTAGPARAISLGIEPVSQDVMLGGSAAVAITISGLGDPGAPSLGVFDLDLAFDPSILAFNTATFGDPVLGDQLDLFGFGSLTEVILGVGTVNLFELSFDFAVDLDTLQAGSFTLVTLSFDTVSLGSSALSASFRCIAVIYARLLFNSKSFGARSAPVLNAAVASA